MPYIAVPSAVLAAVSFAVVVAAVVLCRLPSLVAAKPDRLTPIDGLRGILALAVFFHHFSITYQYKHTGDWARPTSDVYNLLGQASVIVFFMITGFLFFGKIKAIRGRLDLDSFYVGRVFRIVPVYALSVAMVYLLVCIKTGFHLTAPIETSLDGWLFFQASPINAFGFSPLVNAGVLWTLTFEWLFYFSIPLIAFLWRRLDLKSWVIFLATVIALSLTRNPVTLPYVGVSSSFFAPFLLGGLAGEIGRAASLRRWLSGHRGALLSLAAAVALFTGFSTAYSVTAYLVVFLFFLPVAVGNALFGLLRSRPIVFLGEISYAVYMLHGTVLFALFSILMPSAMDHAASEGRLLVLMLIASAAVLVLGTLAHLLVERPMLRIGKRVTPIDAVQRLAAP